MDLAAYNEIDGRLREASDLQLQIAEAEDALRRADQGYRFPPQSLEDLRRMITSGKPRDEDAFQKAGREYARLRVQQHELYNKAIAETIKLYNLVPLVTNQGASGVTTKEPAHDWAPRFMEQKHYDTKAHQWVMDEEADARGLTSPDGRVRILPRGVESPATLAQTIFHETSHWLERTVSGQPLGTVDRWRGEVLAYDLVLENAARLGIVDTTAKKRLEERRDRYRYQADHQERQGHDGKVWLRYDADARIPEDMEDSNVPGRADPIGEVVERAVEERRAAVERRRSDLRLKGALGSIARRVCSDPESVTQGDLDALPMASPDFNAILWPPPPGLGKCGDDLYFTLCMVLEDSTLDLVKVREHYKAHPVEPPIFVPRPAPMIPQSVAIPELVRLACDSPGSLSQEVFDRYLPTRTAMPGLVDECSRSQPGRSACFLGLLQRICRAGPAALNLQRLLSMAQSEQERLSSPTPPPEFPDDGYRERPERTPPEDRCFQDPGSPRGCR
ncbi:MAG: hypothetical protein HY079_13880 [Elusimicrobia bacterium]|nr:hypothetical protein [Elusimicrobiota bacterium]